MDLKMRKFIVRGLIGLSVAIVCVVFVFAYLQLQFSVKKTYETTEIETATADSLLQETTVLEPDAVSIEGNTETGTAVVAQTEGVYLRDLPLTESQSDTLATFGIDTETYYLPPESISCFEVALGTDRYNEILAGDAPSVVEIPQLLKCLP